jgi:molybdopterin-dependent oxidoreductase alpha subunit
MMETKDRKQPEAQPPAKFTGLKLDKPKNLAAGWPALVVSAQHVLRETEPLRALKTLFKLNQKDGFDCPGCAWPDPDDHRSSVGEYCENGVKAIAEELDKRKADAQFFSQHSIYDLSLWSDYEIGKSGRLTQAMWVGPEETHYQPISWADAYKIIAKELNTVNHPDEAVFYTSGRTSNEAAFAYQLFVREYGTNNLPDCSNMCHESSGVALNETIGIGKGTVKLEDFLKTDLILIMGQNPGTNHPRMMSTLQAAKKKGVKIISVNPIREAGLVAFKDPKNPVDVLGKATQLTDLFLQIRINGDWAFLKIVLRCLYDKELQQPGSVFDKSFIDSYTEDFDRLLESLKTINIEELIPVTGLSREEIFEAAEVICGSQKIIACWAMGLTQHKNSVATIQELMNILLLKGSIGKEGAGACPVRGHSNVQGDRTMGIYEKPSSQFLDRLDKGTGIASPRKHGYDTVECIQAMHQGAAKVFFGMGGNFLSATPDTEFTAEALRNCNLTVHVSTKLNRSHLIHGKQGLILPCLSRSDKDVKVGVNQFVTVENSMGIVHSSIGHLEPVSDMLKSETEIVCELANEVMGSKSKIKWMKLKDNYDLIRDLIEASIPGFENFNQRASIPGGFYLPNVARERKFKAGSDRAKFTINTFEAMKPADDELIMMTIRTHDQFNTTVYGLDDRYRGIINERRVVLIHADDMRKLGFKAGDLVDIVSVFNGKERIARKFILVEYPIAPRCIATYFPEANVLIPIDSFADKSQTPTSKSVLVTLIKHTDH